MGNKIAGIDVHKKVLMVVVVDAHAPESKPERRRFSTMPSELRRLSIWLKEVGVEEAVMESTAQYWRSVWLELEPHMRLHLAQAFSNRAPGGRRCGDRQSGVGRGERGGGSGGELVRGDLASPEAPGRGRARGKTIKRTW